MGKAKPPRFQGFQRGDGHSAHSSTQTYLDMQGFHVICYTILYHCVLLVWEMRMRDLSFKVSAM